jgi:hypothetical protein
MISGSSQVRAAAVHIPEQAAEACRTRAAEAVHKIDACATISARLGQTFIDICLTAHTRSAGRAQTEVAVCLIHTRAAVHARLRQALIDIGLTDKQQKNEQKSQDRGRRCAVGANLTSAIRKSRTSRHRSMHSPDRRNCRRSYTAETGTH